MAVDYGKNGYIGTWLCDENGNFNAFPTVTLNFSKSFPDTVPGLTITWSSVYNEWATKYRVTVYHGERVLLKKERKGSSVITIFSEDLSGYDKIVIEVLSWSKPFHRARIEDVFIGITKLYTKSDIMDYSATMFVDPLSASLPKSEITFSLKNLNGEYNLDNPYSTQKYLMERQKVVVTYGFKLNDNIEWIPAGTYYLSGWTTPQNGITVEFTARDAFEFMEDTFDPSALSELPTLYEIATVAFEQADLPLMNDGSKRWYVSGNLASINAPEELDFRDSSIAVVLQCCANAACCVLYQDRSGKIRLEKQDTMSTDYVIDTFNSYENSEVTLSKQLKAIDINSGLLYFPVGLKGETQQVSNDFISELQSSSVAIWVSEYLQNRRIYSGTFRPDPRLDPLDVIKNQNKFATNTVMITSVTYTYNGAFRGSFEGRGIENAASIYLHAGEPLARAGIHFPLYEGDV